MECYNILMFFWNNGGLTLKNNIIKNIIGLICFTLVFSIISPSLAKASEPQDLQINDSIKTCC